MRIEIKESRLLRPGFSDLEERIEVSPSDVDVSYRYVPDEVWLIFDRDGLYFRIVLSREEWERIVNKTKGR